METDISKWSREQRNIAGPMWVRVVPGMRGKIVLLEEAGNFAWYDSSREEWRVVEHGIFPLYRMVCHMIDTHADELPQLIDVQYALEGINVDLVDLTKGVADHPWVTDMRTAMIEQFSVLDRVFDDHKRAARKQLAFMIFFKDSRGRVNMGMLRCRSVVAIGALKHRLDAIQPMTPWLHFYRRQVLELIQQLERNLGRLEQRYENLYNLIYISLARDGKRIDAVLSQIRQLIPKLQIKPYTHTARHLEQELPKIERAIKRRDYEVARQLVQVGYNAILLMRLRKPLELMQLHLGRAAKSGQIDSHLLGMIRSRLGRMVGHELIHIDDEQFETPVRKDVLERLQRAYMLVAEDKPKFSTIKALIDAALAAI